MAIAIATRTSTSTGAVSSTRAVATNLERQRSYEGVLSRLRCQSFLAEQTRLAHLQKIGTDLVPFPSC